MKNNRTKITFISGYTLSSGVKIPHRVTKLESCMSVRRFNNCSHKLNKLSPVSFLLIHYLTEEMSSQENSVSNTKSTRDKFLRWVKQSCNRTFTDSSVQKGFIQLKKQDLIISFSRGDYNVNPLHFCRCNLKARKGMVMDLCVKHFKDPKQGSNLKRAFGI